MIEESTVIYPLGMLRKFTVVHTIDYVNCWFIMFGRRAMVRLGFEIYAFE